MTGCAVVALFGAPAFAQSGGDDEDADTIIVTGEKRDRSLQDTTSSVGVFTSQNLRANALDSLDDVLRLTPNISGNLGQLVIRGVGTFGVSGLLGASFNGQTSLASSVVIDDVIIPQNVLREGFTEMWDIGQVEIFRGPQSTNQGRNALSGGIVVNTNDPTAEFNVAAQGVVQQLDGYRASGAVGGPLVGDSLSARVSVDWFETGGFIDFDPQSGMRDPVGSESLTLRGKLLFTPSSVPDFSARLTLSHIDQNRAFAFQNFDDPSETSTGTNLSETKLTTAALRMEYELSDAISLTSITTGAFQDNAVPFEDNDGTTQPLGFVRSDFDETVYTQELRFDYDAGGRLKLLGGFFYFDSDRENPQEVNTRLATFGAPPPFDALTAIFDLTIDTKVRNWAFFGEAEYQITDRLSVLFGARYDNENFERVVTEDRSRSDFIAIQLLGGAVPGVPGLPPFNQDIDTSFDAFLPKGVITYDWTDNLSTNFSVQRAYRGGGAGQLGAPPLGVDPRFAYEPEYTTTYEGALRSTWLDGDLIVNANVFYTDWENQQASFIVFPFNPANTLVLNAAQSTLHGAELDVRARLTDTLNAYFGLGLLETEFDDFDVSTALGGLPTTGGDFTGNQFPNSPDTTIAAGFNYQHPNGLFLNMNYSYASEQEGDVENLVVRRLDSRNIVDLVAGYQDDHYRLELFVRNLFDEEYDLATQLAIDDATQLSGFLQGDPRVVGGRIRLDF